MASSKPADKAGLELPLINVVANERIWKDYVDQERLKAKNWERNWGFMKISYKDLIKEDLPKLTDPNRKKVELPEYLRVRPATPISSYIHIEPSPKPYPRSTMNEIGWRSSRRELALERYGRYSRPIPGFLKSLRWPVESIV